MLIRRIRAEIGNSLRGSCQERGFTLVEIAIAVAILGVALVTLVGLQTRMLNTYFDERARIRAALYAQYLMTLIEIQPEAPATGSEEKDLESALEKSGYFDTEKFEKAEPEIKNWRYFFDVSSIGLPLGQEMVEDALRRVEIQIAWGEGQDERYSLVYFVAPTLTDSLTGTGATSGGSSASGGGATQGGSSSGGGIGGES